MLSTALLARSVNICEMNSF